MDKVKILKLILLCLIIATLVVGVLVAIQYIEMFNNNREVKDAMTSITQRFDNATNNMGSNTNTDAVEAIDVTYKGYKVVRYNRNT